nr:hypothetical protein [Tanacetum cinerariifolium]
MMSRMDNEVSIRIYDNSQYVEDVIEGKQGSRDSVKKANRAKKKMMQVLDLCKTKR